MTKRTVRVKNNTRARSPGFVTDRNGGNADVGEMCRKNAVNWRVKVMAESEGRAQSTAG